MKEVDLCFFILPKHEHQSSAGLLDGQRNRLRGEAGKQFSHPGLDGFRSMLDFPVLALIRIRRLQRPDMLLVCPINGHKRAEAGLVRGEGFWLAIHVASFWQALVSAKG